MIRMRTFSTRLVSHVRSLGSTKANGVLASGLWERGAASVLLSSRRNFRTGTCRILNASDAATPNKFSNSRDRMFDSEVDFGIRRKGAPVMDIVELHDDPSKGNMFRAVYFGRCVEIARYPQLGPRKTDPNDPMPQFDFKQRAFYRLNKSSIAALIAVCEGKTPLTTIKSRFGGCLEASMIGVEELTLKLNLPNRETDKMTNVAISIKGHYLPMFRNFLEFSLEKSFGFTYGPRPAYERRDVNTPNRRRDEKQNSGDERGNFKNQGERQTARQNNPDNNNSNNNSNSSNSNIFSEVDW